MVYRVATTVLAIPTCLSSPHKTNETCRLSLIGHLSSPVPRNSTEAERLKKCFTARHPDARLWSPGNHIHESDWVTFEVETIYWIGGFGYAFLPS